MEIWKYIKGYNGAYQVSNLGRVMSFKYKQPRILKQGIDMHGYYLVGLCYNGLQKTKHVHQLVAESFLNHKPCKKLKVVDHINANKLDNKVENLQIITNRLNCSKDKKKGSSKYTGVSIYNKDKGIWQSCIYVNGTHKHLGCYKDEYKAHLAYQKELVKTIN